ncbi:hypothetical protein BU14_0254s0030 [Porphyra umbilicalis]|uniref:Uncharacterized protein n=1 Tax=Porphyra umbilicalis TaxID=2786 RepID=A0A1X6P325_PORUM|nr:hypothetical protein BU14_0254s0030 [Porphyra umbilicalis]|eukprot:OSX75150.1 hypothetical protein BU14_0254s0030 [Porphyra umbilicalis]
MEVRHLRAPGRGVAVDDGNPQVVRATAAATAVVATAPRLKRRGWRTRRRSDLAAACGEAQYTPAATASNSPAPPSGSVATAVGGAGLHRPRTGSRLLPSVSSCGRWWWRRTAAALVAAAEAQPSPHHEAASQRRHDKLRRRPWQSAAPAVPAAAYPPGGWCATVTAAASHCCRDVGLLQAASGTAAAPPSPLPPLTPPLPSPSRLPPQLLTSPSPQPPPQWATRRRYAPALPPRLRLTDAS